MHLSYQVISDITLLANIDPALPIENSTLYPQLIVNKQVIHRSEEINSPCRLPFQVQGMGKCSVDKWRFHSWA